MSLVSPLAYSLWMSVSPASYQHRERWNPNTGHSTHAIFYSKCLSSNWLEVIQHFPTEKKYIMVGRYQVSPQKPKCNWTRGLIIVYNPNTLHITVSIAKLLPESKGAFEEHIIPIAVKAPFSLLFLSQSARNHHGEQGERGVTSESRQQQEAGW